MVRANQSDRRPYLAPLLHNGGMFKFGKLPNLRSLVLVEQMERMVETLAGTAGPSPPVLSGWLDLQ